MKGDGKKRDLSFTLAAIQVVFGIIIFTSAWWLGESYKTALYVYGFITVLLGIVTSLALTGNK